MVLSASRLRVAMRGVYVFRFLQLGQWHLCLFPSRLALLILEAGLAWKFGSVTLCIQTYRSLFLLVGLLGQDDRGDIKFQLD